MPEILESLKCFGVGLVILGVPLLLVGLALSSVTGAIITGSILFVVAATTIGFVVRSA